MLQTEHGIEEMIEAVVHQPLSMTASQAAHETKSATAKAATKAVAVSITAAGRLLLSWTDLSISCLSEYSVLGNKADVVLRSYCKRALLKVPCKHSSLYKMDWSV